MDKVRDLWLRFQASSGSCATWRFLVDGRLYSVSEGRSNTYDFISAKTALCRFEVGFETIHLYT